MIIKIKKLFLLLSYPTFSEVISYNKDTFMKILQEKKDSNTVVFVKSNFLMKNDIDGKEVWSLLKNNCKNLYILYNHKIDKKKKDIAIKYNNEYKNKLNNILGQKKTDNNKNFLVVFNSTKNPYIKNNIIYGARSLREELVFFLVIYYEKLSNINRIICISDEKKEVDTPSLSNNIKITYICIK